MAPPASVDRLVDHLQGHDRVSEVQVDDARHPTRVTVSLSTRSVPVGVTDLIEYHAARIVDCHAGTGPNALSITLAAPDGWKDGGPRTVRAIGSSTGLTLPPEALDASGITQDTTVDVHARPGELHIRHHEEGPEPP